MAESKTSENPITVTYTFEGDDPWNTTLKPHPAGDYPTYTARSVSKVEPLFKRLPTEADTVHTSTTVTDDEGTVIATLLWRDTLPDVVTYRHGPQSMDAWMKKSLLNRSKATFQDEQGRKYEWRNIERYRRMELYAHDIPEQSIITFTPTSMDYKSKTRQPGTFALTAKAVEILELVVISFLFLEKTRRRKEKNSERLTAAALPPPKKRGLLYLTEQN